MRRDIFLEHEKNWLWLWLVFLATEKTFQISFVDAKHFENHKISSFSTLLNDDILRFLYNITQNSFVRREQKQSFIYVFYGFLYSSQKWRIEKKGGRRENLYIFLYIFFFAVFFFSLFAGFVKPSIKVLWWNRLCEWYYIERQNFQIW